MNIDFRGATIEGADFRLSKGSHLYNCRLVRCTIDDSEAVYPFATNCILDDCKVRSQWEANVNLQRSEIKNPLDISE